MARYITVEQAKKTVDYAVELSRSDWEKVVDAFDDLPTADVQEVRHGEWIVHKIGGKVWKRQCSVCMAYYRGISPFCKECGARMDGGKE